jgi:hypothetical protein
VPEPPSLLGEAVIRPVGCKNEIWERGSGAELRPPRPIRSETALPVALTWQTVSETVAVEVGTDGALRLTPESCLEPGCRLICR